jgi:predicted nuclease of predicted toxin-antitoxin system
LRFIADENFPLPSVRSLSAAGHDIVAVALESPGISEEAVPDRAVRERRILLTFDSDYGDLLYRKSLPSPEGVVYIRFIPISPEELAEYLLSFLERPEIFLIDLFTVAERDRVRQRPLPRTDPP